MLNVIYVVVLTMVILYGCYNQRRSQRMWKAMQKPTHIDQARWTYAPRVELQQTPEEIERKELEQARRQWDLKCGHVAAQNKQR